MTDGLLDKRFEDQKRINSSRSTQFALRANYRNLLGPFHTTPEKFENVALFLRLGLPSTLIRHANGAFRKRS